MIAQLIEFGHVTWCDEINAGKYCHLIRIPSNSEIQQELSTCPYTSWYTTTLSVHKDGPDCLYCSGWSPFIVVLYNSSG